MSLSPDQKLAAYFLGRRIAGQRRKQDRVPVAYLYNGVRLPGLPEWDKAKYPYAVIFYNRATNGYLLDCAAKPYSVYLDENGIQKCGYSDGCSALAYFRTEINETEWDSSNLEATDSYFGRYHLSSLAQLVWTNCDIPDTDGSVYFSASEPIPVYE